MKGWILPRVTAVNTNLPEVLMAAVMFERTVLISKGFMSSRSPGLAAVLKLTRSHSSPVEVRRSCARKT